MQSRRILVLASAVAVCLILAACGSGSGSSKDSSSGSSSDSAKANAGIRFSECMRANGVPNFPDPGSSGGIQIPDNSGINPVSPAFQSAQNKCFKLLPGGGPGRGQASEQRKLMMLRLSQCMRQHGFPDFPDPTSTQPRPGAGLGIAFGSPGSFIAVPQSMVQSPGFQQAAAACGFPGKGRAPDKGTLVKP